MHASVLRYLKEVARCGSIRKAASALNVASSAVNRQVLKIEEELGVKLFDRLPGGIRLTPAGDVLLRHVRDTLYDYDRLLAEIDGLRGLKSGHVRIVAVDSLLGEFLPSAIESFSVGYPAVTFSVLAAAPAAVFQEVAGGQADIGLTFLAPMSTALQVVASARTPLGAVMRADHPLAGRAVLGFDDFGDFPILLQYDALPSLPFADDEYLAFRNAIKPRVVSNAIELLKHCIQADMGIAFFSRLGFLRELAAGDMKWVPLASHKLQQLQIGIVISGQRNLGPAAAALVNDLGKRLQRLEQGI